MVDGLKKIDITDILYDGDQMFGKSFTPWQHFTDEALADPNMPDEIRKCLSRPTSTTTDASFPVTDAKSSKEFSLLSELQMHYLKAKWDHHIDTYLERMQITSQSLFNEKEEADQHDEWMTPRIEFMYSHLDFRNDRARVRERFVSTMNKKATLEDIGGLLDKVTLDSKARIADYFDPKKHALEQPEAPQRDHTEADFNFMESFLSTLEPIKPDFIDDQTEFNDL